MRQNTRGGIMIPRLSYDLPCVYVYAHIKYVFVYIHIYVAHALIFVTWFGAYYEIFYHNKF